MSVFPLLVFLCALCDLCGSIRLSCAACAAQLNRGWGYRNLYHPDVEARPNIGSDIHHPGTNEPIAPLVFQRSVKNRTQRGRIKRQKATHFATISDFWDADDPFGDVVPRCTTVNPVVCGRWLKGGYASGAVDLHQTIRNRTGYSTVKERNCEFASGGVHLSHFDCINQYKCEFFIDLRWGLGVMECLSQGPVY